MNPLVWLPVLLTIGFIGLGLRLRRRVSRLHVLAPSDQALDPSHRFITAAGVELDPAARRAASAFARQHGLAVVDLVPRDLPVDRAMSLARAVDARTFRADRLAPPTGANHALLADASVLDRAGVTVTEGLDPAAFLRLAARLKQYASTTTDLAVAPTLHGSQSGPRERAEVLRARSPYAPVVLGWTLLTYVALGLGLAASRPLGLVAVATFSAQPLLALLGGPLAPRDLGRGCILRVVLDPLLWARTVLQRGRRPSETRAAELRRDAYQRDLAHGTDRFFETRRDTCPWCGAGDLSVLLSTPDLLQHKPGRFTLERCGSCGHVFQNPRLSPAGLELYYRDFYDGDGEQRLEFLFGGRGREYRERVDMVKRSTTPSAWLDVGAGHGHFCNLARETWPDITFDGLDQSEGIEEAERRRWVDHGYRGAFLERAGELAGRYDVISMFHYLEHTREPLEELDAAAKVLRPGGWLLIELPNPASRLGRVLGRWWVPWLQPQHQHMMPIGNLERALAERGFVTVASELGPANRSGDFTFAVGLAVDALAPNPDLPWLPATGSRWRRIKPPLAWALAAPLLITAIWLDVLTQQLIRRTRGGNCYRVLARLDG